MVAMTAIPTAPLPPSSLVTLRLLLGQLNDAVGRADPRRARNLLDDAIGLLAPPARPTSAPVRSGLAPWQVKRLREEIEAGLDGRLAMQALADSVRLSLSHFSRAFQVSFGLSPHAYVLARRVERAKRLMLETEEPLAQIALACGLSDQAHLSHLFRRLTGTPPNAWRRSARAGQAADPRRQAA